MTTVYLDGLLDDDDDTSLFIAQVPTVINNISALDFRFDEFLDSLKQRRYTWYIL